MTYRWVGILLLVVAFSSCESKEEAVPSDFNTLTAQFLKDYWAVFPTHATLQGVRSYDTTLTLPSADHRQQIRALATRYLEKIAAYPNDSLSPTQQISRQVLGHTLKRLLWEVDTLKAYAWNAAWYNIGPATGVLLKGRFATLEDRLINLRHRLPKAEKYYTLARENLTRPTEVHVDMALEQHEGTLSLLQQALVDSIEISALSGAQKQALLEAKQKAVMAVQDYIRFLEELPHTDSFTTSFRLGKALYARKFHYQLASTYTPETLFALAGAQMEETHVKMLRLTQKMWPDYFDTPLKSLDFSHVQQLLDTLSQNHVPPEQFMQAIEQQMDTLVAYVQKHKLVYIDSSKPLVVRQAPGYLQGIALVSISAPGPFDKYGDTYYNVNDLTQYNPEVAESWLQEYNNYMLQILNIHEAIPGHYVQLAYANEVDNPLLSVFGSNTMIEGWACYAERMMLDHGYEAGNDALQLMYYKWYLRIIANAMIDIGVHTRDWTREKVMDLLMNSAFQEEAEAANKWQRVQRTQVQLCSYFNGLMEILDLRDEMMVQQGAAFDLREFHDRFLSYGSAPVKFIRQAMVNETP